MRMVLLGAPGSGKGAQAARIGNRYGIPLISVTELLRAAMSSETVLGVKAAEAGQPVADDFIFELIEKRLNEDDAARGFVLIGFPRTTEQAVLLEELLAKLGEPLDLVLYIDTDPDVLTERLAGRLTCESCGELYNVFTAPPTVDEVCDQCGGRLHRRAEDNEETIATRLRVFEHQTAPVTTYYRTQGKLHAILEATGVPHVLEELIAQLSKTAVEKQSREPAAEAWLGNAASTSATRVSARPDESAQAAAEEKSSRVRSRKSRSQAKNRVQKQSSSRTTPYAGRTKAAKKKAARKVVANTAVKEASKKKKEPATTKKVVAKKKVSAKKSAAKKKLDTQKPKVVSAMKTVTRKKTAKKKGPINVKRSLGEKQTKKEATVSKTSAEKETVKKKGAAVERRKPTSAVAQRKSPIREKSATKRPAKPRTSARKSAAKRRSDRS